MIRRFIYLAGIVMVPIWLFASYASAQTANYTSTSGNVIPSPNFSTAATPQIPVFDHVFVIIEENKDSSNILGDPQAPYLNSLKQKYSSANNYHAIEHPSLPNYMDITGGSNGGLEKRDCEHLTQTCVSDNQNIADRLDQAGLTWKAYYEDIPGACATSSTNLYDLGVNPFVHYRDVVDNPSRCRSHVVPYIQFSSDLQNPQSLANLSFITPNMCDDMHNCSVRTGDRWLASEVPNLLHSPAFTSQNSLLVITWDEAEDGTGSNQVPLLLIGPAVKESYQSSKNYSHYSLLHTIEASWRLSPLTENDSNAPLLSEFFQPYKPALELLY